MKILITGATGLVGRELSVQYPGCARRIGQKALRRVLITVNLTCYHSLNMPRIALLQSITILVLATCIAGCARPDQQQAATPLFDNLGAHHRAVTTSNELAQKYFDQGLRLIYGFNHEEAERAFREAARLDPNCAMAWWGVAYAFLRCAALHAGKGLRPLHTFFFTGICRIEGNVYGRRCSEEPSTYWWGVSGGAGDNPW